MNNVLPTLNDNIAEKKVIGLNSIDRSASWYYATSFKVTLSCLFNAFSTAFFLND